MKQILRFIKAWYYYQRGSAYLCSGQCKRAITSFDKTTKLTTNFALAYQRRGTAYSWRNQYDQAIMDYNQVIKFNQNDAKTYKYRGSVYFAKGQYDQAIKDFDQAIKLDPNMPGVYRNRAAVYRAKGNCEKALEDIRKLNGWGYNVPIELNDPFWEVDEKSRISNLCEEWFELFCKEKDRGSVKHFEGMAALIYRITAESERAKQRITI